MKCTVILLPIFLLLTACDSPQPGDSHPTMNRWMVDTFYDDMASNAVIAGRTIYPHHFVEGTAELNPRGQRSLSILAKHFKEHGGTLNVRQNETPDDLYQQRVQAVRDALASHDVEADTVVIEDGFSGGDGITSEQWRKPPEGVKSDDSSTSQE